MNIRKLLVSSNVAKKVTYSGKNSKKFIVIHETDNTRKGAGADNHARLQYNGNSRSASWHYQVDGKEIVQSFKDDAQCWAAGNKYYNQNGIQIEICVNPDSDFKTAVKNTVWLVKYLMNKYNIPIENVIQHNRASGKNCPRYLRSGAKGINWKQFIDMVKGIKSSTPKKEETNNIPSTYKIKKGDTFWGISRKYNISVNDIKKYNPNVNPNSLQIGQVIKLKSSNSTSKQKPQPKPVSKYPLPSGILKYGSKGEKVKQLQRALNAVYFKVGKVDGSYGPATKDAVRRFQSMYYGLKTDGIYGPATKAKLEQKLKEMNLI
ncbi:N-acetylmuramoyl-L-alanine amidase [Virgibacillus sp. SK37]|uniref:N-acetylmuramoyl-L-alanine amidase n=1 Tax=Virgibacillus sp. SK37 TaxID=403957 RepID=UPI0004D0DAA4|nr:N-acetylmuramoyl-L-alanine amidase [Virgibacillus sp. SK37]AIF44924.1 N-acetylmuramoyl-L-alanine amidase [Virgibacillus sp. SK37]